MGDCMPLPVASPFFSQMDSFQKVRKFMLSGFLILAEEPA